MPVYDYKCSQHGLFFELAEMQNAHLPAACPQCSALSARVVLMPSAVIDFKTPQHIAHSRNETASHRPFFSTPEARQEKIQQQQHAHKYHKACGCSDKPLNRSKLFYTAAGEKMFPSMRPWMISH